MGALALNEICWLDGSVALVARGVVDDDTVEPFERRLDSASGTGSRQLVIDLTACRLASAGLAALIRLERRSSSRPAATRLVATDVNQLRMLDIVGLTSRFRIYATLDAAHHSCCPAAPPVAWIDGAAASGVSEQRASPEVRQLTSIDRFRAARVTRPTRRRGRAIGPRNESSDGCRQ